MLMFHRQQQPVITAVMTIKAGEQLGHIDFIAKVDQSRYSIQTVLSYPACPVVFDGSQIFWFK
ncbi:hypothetical protein BXT89_17180 [Halopseudomonas pachastrellae]|uniref:Uncharacterized protein n=1 Tax=Halopseudomonas pachastrellae TaxID=254161 RepID=A0A1S8DCQ8_9GAMM|nr:hypothetical protein BXT89_17180 [Halopseudomonas pachastrellae]